MHCKRNRGTLSVSSCIRRQQLIKEYKENISSIRSETDCDKAKCQLLKFKDLDLTKLEKCWECGQGQTILDNPDTVNLDKDVRELKYKYMPKPKRYILQVRYKKHHQMEEKCPLETKRRRYFLKSWKKK